MTNEIFTSKVKQIFSQYNLFGSIEQRRNKGGERGVKKDKKRKTKKENVGRRRSQAISGCCDLREV